MFSEFACFSIYNERTVLINTKCAHRITEKPKFGSFSQYLFWVEVKTNFDLMELTSIDNDYYTK